MKIGASNPHNLHTSLDATLVCPTVVVEKLEAVVTARGRAARREPTLPPRLLDRLGVDRRAGPPSDDQRRSAEEELVDAVGRAICGKLLDVEDLAVYDADRGDRDPVPGLEHVRLGVVRADLDPPGVAADGRDLPTMDPVQRLEGQTRRGTAGIATPLALPQAILHLSRTDDHEVGASYLDALRVRGPVEVGDRDGIPVIETVDAFVAGHVEEHAPADHLVRELLDAVLVRSAAVDERGRISVPHLVAEEHVRQRIPLRSGLRRQIDGV